MQISKLVSCSNGSFLVLTSVAVHQGGRGSIPGLDMSVLIESLHSINIVYIVGYFKFVLPLVVLS